MQDVFVEWIHDVASLVSPPLVHAITHGTDELEVETGVSNEFNNYAIKLGAIGVTLVVQSGENGVNSEYGRCGYWPSFPAVSPYGKHAYPATVFLPLRPERSVTNVSLPCCVFMLQ